MSRRKDRFRRKTGPDELSGRTAACDPKQTSGQISRALRSVSTISTLLRILHQPRCPLLSGLCCKSRFSPMVKILRAVGATFVYKI